MSLLVVGSVLHDTLDYGAGRRHEGPGGAAVYAGLSASILTETELVSAVGEDFDPEVWRELASRMDLRQVRTLPGATGRWHGAYSLDGAECRTVALEMGVLKGYRPRAVDVGASTKAVFIATTSPQIQRAALEQCPADRLVAFDSHADWIESDGSDVLAMAKAVDVVFMTEAELVTLTGEHDLASAADKFLRFRPSLVVAKRGHQGSIGFTSRWRLTIGAVPTTVVDVTGAGDSFAGATLAMLSSLPEPRVFADDPKRLGGALSCGAAAAALAIGAAGTGGILDATRADIERSRRSVEVAVEQR